MKNLWETLRIAIETSSRNKKLEDLYIQIIHKAFEFCKKYNRKAEFKRLCESLRYHLNSIIKAAINPEQYRVPFPIDLTNPESSEKQMALRFEELEYIYEFGLWQEAIKTLEDIHHLLQKRKAIAK